jgi:hypothetical protein
VLEAHETGQKGSYRYGMLAISALETPLSDFLDSFLLGRWVNKGKREGRSHSTMALQVLPVRGGLRFLRLAHPTQPLIRQPTVFGAMPPCVAHNGVQTSSSSAGPQVTDVQVKGLLPSLQEHCVRFGPAIQCPRRCSSSRRCCYSADY